MSVQIILIIVCLVLVFFLFFKLLRTVFKALIAVFVLSLVLFAFFGLIIYADAVTLKNGLQGEKTIIMTDDDVIAGFRVSSDVSLSSALNQEFYEPLSSEELISVSEKVSDEKYDEIEKKELLLIIDHSIFFDDELNFNGVSFVADEAFFNKLASSSLAQTQELLESKGISSSVNDLNDLKSSIYYELFKNKLKETNGKFIIQGVKNKKIKTLPELLSIKILNFFPEKLIEKISKENK